MFLSYGGLRGSVGIALAINFYRTVLDKTRDDPSAQAYAVLASQFVFMSGGISLLSLLVNGTTAGMNTKVLCNVSESQKRVPNPIASSRPNSDGPRSWQALGLWAQQSAPDF